MEKHKFVFTLCHNLAKLMLLRLSIAFPRVIYDNTIGIDRPLHRTLAELVKEHESEAGLRYCILYVVMILSAI